MSEDTTRLLFVMSGLIFGMLCGGAAAKALWAVTTKYRVI